MKCGFAIILDVFPRGKWRKPLFPLNQRRAMTTRYLSAVNKQRQAEAEAKGNCIQCFEKPALPKRKRCAGCNSQSSRTKDYHACIAEGRCVNCKRKPVIDTRCAECRNKVRRQANKRSRNQRMCRCGHRPPRAPGKRSCEICFLESAALKRERSSKNGCQRYHQRNEELQRLRDEIEQLKGQLNSGANNEQSESGRVDHSSQSAA